MAGRLTSDPLFQGLTRPAMMLGVSYTFFVINAGICMITFINTQNWLVIFLLAPALHGLFYVICLKEPRALEMFMIKMNKGFKCINKAFHGYTNSYDPN